MTDSRPSFKLSPAKRTVFWLITLALVLFVIEVAMIVLEPVLFRGFYQYDPDLGFRVRPGAGHSNSFGFNDREYSQPKPDDVYRIAMLSDSFNWAGGRKRNYTARLGNLFATRYDSRRIEVINIGYPMTHTGEQLAVLKKFGLQYGPDLVVLGFVVGNDFLDADPNRKRIIVNDTYFDIDRGDEIVILGYPVILRSRLIEYVRQKLKTFREIMSTEFVTPANAFTDEAYRRILTGQLAFFDKIAHAQNKFNANIENILDSIDAIHELLTERGIDFVVTIFPDQLQVNAMLTAEIIADLGHAARRYDLNLGNRILIEHLQRRRIPFIDLTPAFRQETGKRSLYIAQDTHWNDAGNRLAADLIFEYLNEHLRSIRPPRLAPAP